MLTDQQTVEPGITIRNCLFFSQGLDIPRLIVRETTIQTMDIVIGAIILQQNPSFPIQVIHEVRHAVLFNHRRHIQRDIHLCQGGGMNCGFM